MLEDLERLLYSEHKNNYAKRAIVLDVDGTIIETSNTWNKIKMPFLFKAFTYLGRRKVKAVKLLEYILSFLVFKFSDNNKEKKRNLINYFYSKFKECNIELVFVSNSFTFTFLKTRAPFFKSYKNKDEILRMLSKEYDIIAYITDSREEEYLKNCVNTIIKVKDSRETYYLLKFILSRCCQNR